MKQHSLKLVQEEEGLYECSNCNKRGFWKDFINDECGGGDDNDSVLSNNQSYGINDNTTLGRLDSDPID